MKLVHNVPDEQALRQGLLGASGIYINETPLVHCVGETGIISVTLQMLLEAGKVRWTKGQVAFERKINLQVAN